MSDLSGTSRALDAPGEEVLRLMTLHGLSIMDSEREESFDRVTRLAARVLNAPICLVSLVDESRQWFKSCFGLDVCETAREISFCQHAIAQTDPFVIRNALLDPRFVNNPLVTGPPDIRAYLGIPLVTREGLAIGTLCAIDRKPRMFPREEIQLMQDLAMIVQDLVQARERVLETRGLMNQIRENELMFRETFEQAPVAIFHTGMDGRLLRANSRACELLGYTLEDMRAMSFVDITHPDDIGDNSHLFQQMVSGHINHFDVEKRFLRKDGSYVWAQLSTVMRRSAKGLTDHAISIVRDISGRKQMETQLVETRDSLQTQVTAQTRKLKDTNESLRRQVKQAFDSTLAVCKAEYRLRAVANSVPALIGYWNAELRCEFANRAYHDWFGFDPEKVVGMRMQDFLGPELFGRLEPRIRLALNGQVQQFERAHTRADGSPIITDTKYMPEITAQGEVRGFFVLVTDVTLLRNAQQELEKSNSRLATDSVTDYLTGLVNRRMFSDKSEEASQRSAAGEPYGLILLDLDDFKRINDRYGHDIGDEVLRVVGRVLQSQLRGNKDLAARLGGEEFAILCSGASDEASLRELAERIREQINKEAVQSPLGIVQFTSSFGVAGSQADDSDWKTIYGRADAALYQAKASGKDCVIFSNEAASTATGRFRSLRRALNPY